MRSDRAKLDGLNAYGERELREFHEQLRGARDSFEVLQTVSKHAHTPYAQRVNTMTGIYREDAGLVRHLKDAFGFHTETISARNIIPALRAKQFDCKRNAAKAFSEWPRNYKESAMKKPQ